MPLFEILRVALKALRRNPLRSFLTVLGIIIGVASVIAMVAIGEGARSRVEQSFAAMGTNLLIVMPGSSSSGGFRGGGGTQPSLTWEDLRSMQREVPGVKYAAVQLRTGASLAHDDRNWSTSVTGTSPDFFAIRNWPAAQGSLFTVSDITAGAKVAVLGSVVANELFEPGDNPVGQIVRIKHVPFQVIGVLASKGQSSSGQDYDDAVFVPQTTFQSKLQARFNRFITGAVLVSVAPESDMGRVQTRLEGLLRDRHHLGEDDQSDFSIRNLAEMASAQQEGSQTLAVLLASIAAVSLVVGGIGVMNIMLVSVTERTREIGLRMAVGATPGDVLRQFLAESVVLTFIGGLIGVAIGTGAALQLAQAFEWPIVLRPEVSAIAVLFSGFIGVGFGLFPAQKAARLNPIEALKFE